MVEDERRGGCCINQDMAEPCVGMVGTDHMCVVQAPPNCRYVALSYVCGSPGDRYWATLANASSPSHSRGLDSLSCLRGFLVRFILFDSQGNDACGTMLCASYKIAIPTGLIRPTSCALYMPWLCLLFFFLLLGECVRSGTRVPNKTYGLSRDFI